MKPLVAPAPPVPRARLRLGAHLSTSGGLHTALERGAALGCDVVQLFTKSNKQWRARPLGEADLEAWVAARRRTGVEPAAVHASYLINLASPDPAVAERSRESLGVELDRCDALDVPALVLHPGAHRGLGEAEAVRRIAAGARRVLEERPDGRARLLFETMAGQGTTVGHRFAHLRDLLDGVGLPGRTGVCLDTCHVLAAGHDLRTEEGYESAWEELDRTVGWAQVHAVHVNDSKRPCGSCVDRHEHLGRGHLGLRALRRLLGDPRFAGLPLVIETPKKTPHSDPINLAVLEALAGRRRVGPRARRLAEQALDRPPVC